MNNQSKTTGSSKSEEKDSSTLPGWPGYRTRHGRSGLDPIDSRTEGAHMFGVLVRSFFTLSIKIKNPLYLFLLAVFGLLLVLPVVFAVSETLNANALPFDAWIVMIGAGVIGIFALVNFLKNFVRKSQ